MKKAGAIACVVLCALLLQGDKVEYKTSEGAGGTYEGLVFSKPGDERVKILTADGHILYVKKEFVVNTEIDDKLPGREDKLKLAELTERNMLLERDNVKLHRALMSMQEELDKLAARLKALETGSAEWVDTPEEAVFISLVKRSEPVFEKGWLTMEVEVKNTGKQEAKEALLAVFLYNRDAKVLQSLDIDLLAEGGTIAPGEIKKFTVKEKLDPGVAMDEIVSYNVVAVNNTEPEGK